MNVKLKKTTTTFFTMAGMVWHQILRVIVVDGKPFEATRVLRNVAKAEKILMETFDAGFPAEAKRNIKWQGLPPVAP
ncbi:MAG: hypothetical protein WKF37_08725 [Bryobacteraceae bacterium]